MSCRNNVLNLQTAQNVQNKKIMLCLNPLKIYKLSYAVKMITVNICLRLQESINTNRSCFARRLNTMSTFTIYFLTTYSVNITASNKPITFVVQIVLILFSDIFVLTKIRQRNFNNFGFNCYIAVELRNDFGIHF